MPDWQDFLAALGGFGAGASQGIAQVGQRNRQMEFQQGQQERGFAQQHALLGERMSGQEHREQTPVPPALQYLFPGQTTIHRSLLGPALGFAQGKFAKDRFGNTYNTHTGETVEEGPMMDWMRKEGAGEGAGNAPLLPFSPTAPPGINPSTGAPPGTLPSPAEGPQGPPATRERLTRTRRGISAFGVPTRTVTESPYTTSPDYLTAFSNLGLDPNYKPTQEESRRIAEEVGKIRAGYKGKGTAAGIQAQAGHLPELGAIAGTKAGATAQAGLDVKTEPENVASFANLMAAVRQATGQAGMDVQRQNFPLLMAEKGYRTFDTTAGKDVTNATASGVRPFKSETDVMIPKEKAADLQLGLARRNSYLKVSQQIEQQLGSADDLLKRGQINAQEWARRTTGSGVLSKQIAALNDHALTSMRILTGGAPRSEEMLKVSMNAFGNITPGTAKEVIAQARTNFLTQIDEQIQALQYGLQAPKTGVVAPGAATSASPPAPGKPSSRGGGFRWRNGQWVQE